MSKRPRDEGTTRRMPCPECEVTVREDRLEAHLSSVHPRAQVPEELKSRLKDVGRKAKVSKKGRRGGDWTRGRVVMVTVVVAVLILVVYAVLRAPSPGTVSTGKVAPNFAFTDLDGTSHSLSSYTGHPLVVWFITTFCSSCAQGTQLFANTYYSQYHSAGVTLIEVESYGDLGQSGPTLQSFASQNGYSGQAGWVMGVASSQGTSTYNPNGYLDFYYVINAQENTVASGPDLPGAFGSALQEA